MLNTLDDKKYEKPRRNIRWKHPRTNTYRKLLPHCSHKHTHTHQHNQEDKKTYTRPRTWSGPTLARPSEVLTFSNLFEIFVSDLSIVCAFQSQIADNQAKGEASRSNGKRRTLGNWLTETNVPVCVRWCVGDDWTRHQLNQIHWDLA